MAEHLPFKQRVIGSNPIRLIKTKEKIMVSRLFTNLCDEEIKLLLDKMEKKVYSPGQDIFTENDKGTEMYLIDSGSVEVFIERKGKRIERAKLSEGDFFGEMAILREDTRSATVRPVDKTALLALSRDVVSKLIETDGKLAAKFLLNLSEVLAQRIANTNKEVENWFLINDALVENEQFRKIYFKSHNK